MPAVVPLPSLPAAIARAPRQRHGAQAENRAALDEEVEDTLPVVNASLERGDFKHLPVLHRAIGLESQGA